MTYQRNALGAGVQPSNPFENRRDSPLASIVFYLHRLQWDGKERIPTLFPALCGTADNPYHQHAAKVLMLSAAARILDPGCRVDQWLVLEGRQGVGKSTFLQVLFGKDYFSTRNRPEMWCIEISEIDRLSKAEAMQLKKMLDASTDSMRRQGIYVMATHEASLPTDLDATRRFLPVRIQCVDVDSLAAIRDQLWAEAMARLWRGESWQQPTVAPTSTMEITP